MVAAMLGRSLLVLALSVIGSPISAGWKNPAKSPSLNEPLFGTHDYIAFKAYVLVGRPSWVRFNLRSYFIGTEAPDNGFMPADAEDSHLFVKSDHNYSARSKGRTRR